MLRLWRPRPMAAPRGRRSGPSPGPARLQRICREQAVQRVRPAAGAAQMRGW